MTKNPFFFQGPVTEPYMAYFRDVQAVDSIVNGLLLGHYYTLLGPRLSGTTSMTWDVLRTACQREQHCQYIYVDLQNATPVTDDGVLFQGIAKTCQAYPGELRSRLCNVVTCDDFRKGLLAIVRGKPTRLILAFDHLDSDTLPFDLVKSLARCARVLYNQRLTDPEHYKISVLISGAQSPYALSTGSGSPFNIADSYLLRDLSFQEIAQLIEIGQELSGIHFDLDAIKRIALATQGDKYFIQRICHLCVERILEKGQQIVTEGDVADVIDQLVGMDYSEDRCFMSVVRSLKTDPELVGILVELLEGKEVIASECLADVNRMQLTGILKIEAGRYKLRNELYERFLHHDSRKTLVRDGWKIHKDKMEQAKRLIGLHDIAIEMASALDPITSLNKSVWMILKATESDITAVYLFDRATDQCRVEAIASTDESLYHSQTVYRDELARRVLAERNPIVIDGCISDSRCDLGQRPCSCLWLPLYIGNEGLGALAIIFNGYHYFSSNEITTAEIVASHLATTLIRSKLIDALQAVGGIDITGASRDMILQEIADSARRLLNLPVALVWGYTGKTPEFEVVAYSGKVIDSYIRTFRLRTDSEPTKSFLQRDTPLYLKNVQQAPGYRDKTAAKDMNWHSLLSMPLKAHGHPIGVIEVYSYEEWHVTPWQRALLKLLANQAAGAIENAQFYHDLARAYSTLDESFKILTHELRAEPAFVTNTLTTLLAGKLGKLNSKQRNRIDKALRRLNEYHKLIDNLSMYGRLKGGKITPCKRPVQLEEVIRRVTNAYRKEARRGGVSLKHRVKRLPIVEADEGMIELILMNLLSNSIKFTQQGGQILVRAWANTGGIHILVEDTGIGIPPAEREKIFDEYYQVQSNIARVQKGLGLGLYIAKRLVEMHQGHIAVVEKEGPGTCIAVTLPMSSANML